MDERRVRKKYIKVRMEDDLYEALQRQAKKDKRPTTGELGDKPNWVKEAFLNPQPKKKGKTIPWKKGGRPRKRKS